MHWPDLWSSPDVKEAFGESLQAIKSYLWLARNTESPRQYHLWSLLSLTSALVSNHCHLNHGVGGKKKLNLGVVLTGRPALRKSSAISFMQRFADGLPLNFGPTDTAGARHGIMAAMQARWQDDIRDEIDNEPETLEQLAGSSFDSIITRMSKPRTRPSSIFFAAKELGRLLTSQTRELLDFFADGLDGESIFYQTKNGNIRIPTPLINLLGATTPGSLTQILPRDAHDHGLLSRLIFVYAAKGEASVPVPPAMTPQEMEVQSALRERLERVLTDVHGEIHFAQDALAEYNRLYEYTVPTLEFRLNAYAGRRADHLAKIAALICLLRADAPYIVSATDVGLAHFILALTEIDMDGAYMGLDKSVETRAYSLIRELIESQGEEAGDRGIVLSTMIRAGFSDEEFVRVSERLMKSGRLEMRGNRFYLANSIGMEKAGIYLESFINRTA